jgi:hypothetical protein
MVIIAPMGFFFCELFLFVAKNGHHLQEDVEKVGNYLKEDLTKPSYKSKHESTKRSGWLEWHSHRLPTSYYKTFKHHKVHRGLNLFKNYL